MACMKKGSSKNGYLCHFLFFSDARMGTSLNMGEVAYDLLFAHKSIIDISIFYDIINIVRSFNNGALVQGENASLAVLRWLILRGDVAQWESTCMACKGSWVRLPSSPLNNCTVLSL